MHTLVLGLLLMTGVAHARGATGGAVSGYNKPDDTKGLCTPENKGDPYQIVEGDCSANYMARGYCQSLQEILDKPCVNELVEKIRQRRLGEGKAYDEAKKNNPENASMDLGFDCNPEDGSNNMDKILRDKEQFKYLLMQFMAATVVNESDWDVCNNVTDSPQNPVGTQGEGKKGLLNLQLKDMDDDKFSCGCKVTNSKGEAGEYESPGPADGHHSMVCGTYMALYWAEKDGTLYAGGSKKKGEDGKPTVKGAARVFASLENNNTDGKDPAPIKLLRSKIKKFCDQNMSSKTRTLQQDLEKLRGNTSGTTTR